MADIDATDDPAAELTPAEMADRSGVTIDTLRYYEREGLIDPVAREANGHRRYRSHDVLWVGVLRCLRETGMTIEQLRHYCELGQQGEATQSERRDLLLAHRLEVEKQIAARNEALRLIDHKLTSYPPADRRLDRPLRAQQTARAVASRPTEHPTTRTRSTS